MKKFKKPSKIAAMLLIMVLFLPLILACGENEDTAATKDVATDAVAGAEENNAKDEANAEENAPTVETNEPAAEPEEPVQEDVPDSGTVKLLGQDFETGGDWIGSYGSEGYVIAEENDELNFIPAYATMMFADDQFYTWWDSDSGDPAHPDDEEIAAAREASALYKSPDKTARLAACWYETYYFNLTINVGDTPKKVTLYMNDYDSYQRSAEVTTKNSSGKTMKEPAEKIFFDVDEFVGGCYISYEVSGEVMFEFDCYGGNVTLSGVFFDPIS